MACTGAVSSTCTGHATGEACASIKTLVTTLSPLATLVLTISGTTATLTWATGTSYPTHLVRGHTRKIDATYDVANAFELVARDTGALVFSNLTAGAEYWIWLRVENATQVAAWIVFSMTATPGSAIPLDFVLYDSDLVTHQGELVIF
jgi:hypothetical protein